MKVVPKTTPLEAVKYDGNYESYIQILNLLRGGAYWSTDSLSMWERGHPVYILRNGSRVATVYEGDVIIKLPNSFLYAYPIIVLSEYEVEENFDILE